MVAVAVMAGARPDYLADLQREPADLGEMPPVPPHEPGDLLTLVTGTVGTSSPCPTGL